MSCSDSISRTYFQYNVVANYIDDRDNSALVARLLAAIYSSKQESEHMEWGKLGTEEKAYEIKITSIVHYESFNRVKKVEAIQTKTITFFRYMNITTYRDYDVINDEKFFLDEDEAITYWNQAISRDSIMIPNYDFALATA